MLKIFKIARQRVPAATASIASSHRAITLRHFIDLWIVAAIEGVSGWWATIVVPGYLFLLRVFHLWRADDKSCRQRPSLFRGCGRCSRGAKLLGLISAAVEVFRAADLLGNR